MTRRVLDACSISPGQRRTARKVEAVVRAKEITKLAGSNSFARIQDLQGDWLPGLAGADAILIGLSDAARYLAAANAAFGAHHRLNHLKGFDQATIALENQLRANRTVFTQPYEDSLRALREAASKIAQAAEKEAAGLLPNPFRAGDPLTGENGPELFRGRTQAIRDIENILADASHAASLQLLAPRRSGKTSLLKMLPGMLPDAVCVFYDLQANPAASASAFWSGLARQALIQAKVQRQVDLPAFPDGPAIEAAVAWFEKLDSLPNQRRILIAIDEFERLEDLFPGNRQEFLQLMGLLRATIQHRRNVRLLVSGAAPFTDLDRVWDDHFINARQIKLPFLDEAASIGLLTQPENDFPPSAIPADVAQNVFERTGGQPYLLQIFGSLLVDHLNIQKRQSAILPDIQAVHTKAIEWAEPYFRDMHRDATPETRAALTQLARGEAIELAPRVQRWLAQRYLLTPADTLAVPLYGDWIEHHALV